MHMFRSLSKALLAIPLLALVVTTASAAEEKPSGTIDIKLTSAAAGVGWEWGGGTLTLNDGSQHHFKVSGFTAVDVGISTVEASGHVYRLNNLADFNGKYTTSQASAAFVEGAGYIHMNNEKGVVITLKSKQEGVRLKAGPSGLTITLTD